MSLSFAQGEFVDRFLSDRGVFPDVAIWRWNQGLKGGVFPEHVELNGEQAETEFDFPDHPDTAVNAAYCQCVIQIRYRDTRGRFAPPPTISDFTDISTPKHHPKGTHHHASPTRLTDRRPARQAQRRPLPNPPHPAT